MPAPRQLIYAALSMLGLLGTGWYNLQFAQGPDASLAAFVAGGLANPAAASLTVDVSVCFLVFAVFAVVEGRRLGMRYVWLYLVFALVGALASAFPLFLWMRERALDQGR